MKRVAISAALLLGVCALVVGSYFYITRSTSEIIGKAEMVLKSCERGDYEQALRYAEEVRELWNKFGSNRLIWAENEYIMEINASVAKVLSLAKIKNAELYVECAALLAVLSDFLDMQAPNYKNIF